MTLSEMIEQQRLWDLAASGVLGEEALGEEVKRRYREQGGGSYVDLLSDRELYLARTRLSGSERFWKWVNEQASPCGEFFRRRRERASRRAKSEARRRYRDPLRASLIEVIAEQLRESDELEHCEPMWRHLIGRIRTTAQGFSIEPDGVGLRIRSPGRKKKKSISRRTFERYFAEAKELLKPSPQ